MHGTTMMFLFVIPFIEALVTSCSRSARHPGHAVSAAHRVELLDVPVRRASSSTRASCSGWRPTAGGSRTCRSAGRILAGLGLDFWAAGAAITHEPRRDARRSCARVHEVPAQRRAARRHGGLPPRSATQAGWSRPVKQAMSDNLLIPVFDSLLIAEPAATTGRAAVAWRRRLTSARSACHAAFTSVWARSARQRARRGDPMFDSLLIANRGDHRPRSGRVAAQADICAQRMSCRSHIGVGAQRPATSSPRRPYVR